MHICCPPNKIYIVVKKAAEGTNGGNWVKCAYTFPVFLSGQKILIIRMKVKLP